MNWKKLNMDAVLILANSRIEKTLDSKNQEMVCYTILKKNGEVRHVDINTRKGHNYWTCDCTNCLKKEKEKESICSNKIAIIMQGQREIFK